MIRMHAISSADAAIAYFAKSDSGLAAEELRREWGGKGPRLLGLSGEPDFGHFKNLVRGLDPRTGEQLTAKLIDNRIPAWDVTASIPKGVTVALERGDTRIHDLLWRSVRNVMADIEAISTTRVRQAGEHDDRVTGNLTWFGVEHPETRPSREDHMPDPDRHVHVVVMNLTYDKAEGQWKAVKFRPVMDLRKYFDRRFDAYMAKGLADLGYEIETKRKSDGRYHTWDIKDIPESVVRKFSRRTAEVEDAERRTLEAIKARDPDGAPERLSAVARDKLGATSRLHKRKGLTLEDYRRYWDRRITGAESKQIAETIRRACRGQNPKPANSAEEAVSYAVAHHFERQSVVDFSDLAVTAMERSMGGAAPSEVEAEALRQGVLVKGGRATTREVLAQEARVIGFARSGRGAYGRMGDRTGRRVREAGQLAAGQNSNRQRSYAEPFCDPATASPPAQPKKTDLSPEQEAICRHVWDSTSRVTLIRGAAGTGKTHTMKAAVAGIDKPVVVLAPSAEASRGVLRREGFTEADTVSRFLDDEKFRESARGGVIWVDEAGMLSMRQADRLFAAAAELDARIVLQGDKRQHSSVERGAVLRVLEEFAGLPVAELSEVRRQKHAEYREAVAAISKGDLARGFDRLNTLGWVERTEGHGRIVEDYLDVRASGKSVLVVAPSHRTGDEITCQIRERLKQRDEIGRDEVAIPVLRPTHWTEAERADQAQYRGDEIVQMVRSFGDFKAGQRVKAADLFAAKKRPRPEHYAVYRPAMLGVSAGDAIRITANGLSKGEKPHRVNNGAGYLVKAVSEGGEITLDNGWVLPEGFGHIDHGYVTTSHASQGRTVDHVLVSMGEAEGKAVNAEQFYVSASRARDSVRIYSDMETSDLRQAVQRSDPRTSAVELLGEPPAEEKRRPAAGNRRLIEKMRRTYRMLREKIIAARKPSIERPREREHAR